MGSGASSASGQRWHSVALGSGSSSASSFSEGRKGRVDVAQLSQRLNKRIVRQGLENKVDFYVMGSGASSASGRRWHSEALGSGASSASSFPEGRKGHIDMVQLSQLLDKCIIARQGIENKVDDAAGGADTSRKERACKQRDRPRTVVKSTVLHVQFGDTASPGEVKCFLNGEETLCDEANNILADNILETSSSRTSLCLSRKLGTVWEEA